MFDHLKYGNKFCPFLNRLAKTKEKLPPFGMILVLTEWLWIERNQGPFLSPNTGASRCITSHIIDVKDEIINNDTSAGQRKIWVPDRNRTHDLPNTGWALYPLSYENSWRARPFYWVLMWHASCILLGSAMSMSSWIVINESDGEFSAR